ncbi:NAD-glutamate dehydrogenase [Pontibacterium granulatum]|uniref:NAD-glutamate dehydrogenase n=1 Tax=Pontibacterium granulatum TaxID=2036029 RepID=UPI00249CD01B|nr:NAD-glutamate dehydrogenase [Pontibacterium granulatum]MDI3323375.1 NAD-glutamate dehydrogenase [Pontibacterium granulatum]
MSNHCSRKEKLLNQLAEQVNHNLPADVATKLNTFSELYYQVSPDEEVSARPLEQLYDATLSCWEFIQDYDYEAPKVRVFNPDLEKHGWHSNHTVIQILFPDMPFLVDSVRMELNRREVSIHAIHNAVLQVERDGDKLKGFSHEGRDESFIYLEVDRHSDKEWIKTTCDALVEIHRIVECAVHDYKPMKARAQEMVSELRAAEHVRDRTEAEEAAEFIAWLLDDHFTFLAYDELDFEQGEDSFSASLKKDSVLGTLRLENISALAQRYASLSADEECSMQDNAPLLLAKYSKRSRVHRPAYMDLIVVKRFDDEGRVVGERRFYGLYTSPVYHERLNRIPLIRRKVERTLHASGFSHSGYSGKALLTILNDMPRDELFLSTDSELMDLAMGILNLQERRKARLLMRRDRCGKFCTFLYYVPRDVFGTVLRLQVQDIIAGALKATDSEFTTTFTESVLARVYYVMRIDPTTESEIDFDAIEAEVVQASRSWDDDLHHALVETCGEEKGNRYTNQYRHAFRSAYREHFSPASAVYDIQRIEALSEDNPVTMSFYRVLEQTQDLLRFKLFNADKPLILSDVIPVLENLGMQVVGEHPYEVHKTNGNVYWIHDFTLIYHHGETVVLEDVKQVFQEAFASIWSGRAENDEFNKLVIGGNLSWREVAMLRAYARYNQQIRFGFSQPYIADTLARHLQVSKLLVALFRARFEPSRQDSSKVEALVGRIESSIVDALDKVDNLNDDQILRRYLELIKATLRTNYFQKDAQGELKDYFSFKLSPHAIADIPLPRPMFEVFVYSARVEGVHLRGGKVARGGLRWSDRLEDYRTEVLGLVKAQQVKNAVIVPVGAKGGFVAKQLPERGSREEIQAEGIASYQTFISALLDITDDLKAGEVVPPVDVVRLDEDDPYFVVAADKGTATFSDIANEIAESRDFWLGDAFASGGSQGYDHKGMGITARGAWESVKLHFRELGLDTQSEDFTVIGIGDMAGDVFGNGMLLSEHIQLCAAFNHMHIFIDPNPDAASTYVERKRMFELPRSSWEDYDKSLISAGGGVFSRAAKWIEISPEMKARFDIKEDRLSPNDLLRALLKAPVDLIWNGGIGTYVKGSGETHADVGDKANDSLRINGNELRCRVLGEGGNLGFTQLGRVEFCAKGGKSNTDFIDNAGGVDCSDHEVNIKILLNEVVANGDMTVKQRNALLREMTDEVAELVLQNNYHQAQAISVAEGHARNSIDDYIHLIDRLEDEGKLNRALEFIPADDDLQERKARQQGLTRPELSVLISYVKAELKESLIDSWITSDDYLSNEILTAFPQRLVSDFEQEIRQHRLYREIIATQTANGMVNTMGITFVERLRQSSGAGLSEISAAYVIARDVFDIQQLWADIEALDNQVPSALQQKMMADMIRLVRRATLWFLRHRHQETSVSDIVAEFRPGVRTVRNMMADLIKGDPRESWQRKNDALVDAGIPEELAAVVAGSDSLYSLLGIIKAVEETGQPLERVAQIYFDLGERLELHWFDQQLKEIKVSNLWQTMARDGCREDLTSHQQAITVSLINAAQASGTEDSELCAEEWLSKREALLHRWQRFLSEIRSSSSNDFSIFSVATRELLELAQAR